MADTIVPYTKKQLVERVKRHIANGFPSADLTITDNEVALYLDQAIAFTMVGQVYNNAKIEGNIAIPEAYLTTYKLTYIYQDIDTGEWSAELPQPPVSLPLGYSITDVYPIINGKKGQSFLPIKSKRTAFRDFMPRPSGGFYKIIGNKIILGTDDGQLLNKYKICVEMAKTRTSSMNEQINMPDDAIELVFQNVITKLKERLQLPQDIIKDDLPAGNKSS